jgi:hypothetical protein
MEDFYIELTQDPELEDFIKLVEEQDILNEMFVQDKDPLFDLEALLFQEDDVTSKASSKASSKPTSKRTSPTLKRKRSKSPKRSSKKEEPVDDNMRNLRLEFLKRKNMAFTTNDKSNERFIDKTYKDEFERFVIDHKGSSDPKLDTLTFSELRHEFLKTKNIKPFKNDSHNQKFIDKRYKDEFLQFVQNFRNKSS